MSNLKAKIHSHCLQLIEERIHAIKKIIIEARMAANDETKSSAGDKYETGRAMMQLEQEKAATQLAEAQKTKLALTMISPDSSCQYIYPGALVTTITGQFYISVGLGMIEVEEIKLYAISPESPAGKAMKNLKSGDSYVLNGKTNTILAVE